VPAANTNWYEKVFGSLDQQIRIHKLYIAYVNRYSAYPTREDFLSWVYHNTVPKPHPRATVPRRSMRLQENEEMERRNVAAHA
jgi:hypothetical protein